MFSALTDKLQALFSTLRGQKELTEDNIKEAVREVRLALLEADVNFAVVSQFVNRVKEKAIGLVVLKSVKPGEQFTKLVYDELVSLMGGEEAPLHLRQGLSVVMLCGLQGSGKTTTCAKLAAYIGKVEKRKKILLAACDLQRPAAVEQLKKLGSDLHVPVFSLEGENSPIKVAKLALEKAKLEGFEVLIVDTAGRLHVDEALMEELEAMKRLLEPHEVLFVANATTGQDAVKTAAEFDKRVAITGTILSMLDGNARAGAAISIREVTGKPLKFEGVGEKIQDLQVFNPRSMADRILGMGDVINLMKKAQENITREESQELEKKLRKASFTYEDYLKQMGRVRKMGSFKGLLKMLPGLGKMGEMDFDDGEFNKMEAIIFSMTPEERLEKVELEHGRRKRIALGSGVPVDDVNRMVKSFKRIKQLFKHMPDMKAQMKKMGGMPDLEQLKEQFKGKKWR
ncbi:MAG: signal recognition particle protein [Chlamydiae bacterium RIFCSPHIGHO2_12_FULL_44_59]|nr:MAG: signal recognition particle protein [Chlamydiae bacterium RIFCSPHIGHO2_01_FULL_44_39]OGN60283.1 MAG: signal recognition particle protein [Chlamydiae bacterium RIFCSPHIGHO2_12_FULL_44_59]OGN67064.1 MAG: signal recognition particle protein [Chlamydiae bacterium RIFCSPLOWO2_01_FULL_44_52]OGN67654.1 MAG: signal recognition particle protein [Chlamydiae bacterium RIFCSPLOWO2_02_FULL_45_22]OGN71357.1 MAG: signal recognition particle protein [Chlamydiae bacterium RIFCSPLOWO2_12_FULL_45_20]